MAEFKDALSDLIGEETKGLSEVLAKMIGEHIARAYRRGFNAGRQDALRVVLDAINNGDGIAGSVPVSSPVVVEPEKGKSERAPRGSVRPVVLRILASREPAGAKTSEVQNSFGQFSDGDISPLSVANELRRQKGTLYRQDADGNWHLTEAGEDAATDPEKDRAPEPSTSSTGALDTNQGATHAAALV